MQYSQMQYTQLEYCVQYHQPMRHCQCVIANASLPIRLCQCVVVHPTRVLHYSTSECSTHKSSLLCVCAYRYTVVNAYKCSIVKCSTHNSSTVYSIISQCVIANASLPMRLCQCVVVHPTRVLCTAFHDTAFIRVHYCVSVRAHTQ